MNCPQKRTIIELKPPLPRLGSPKSSPSAFNSLIRKAAQATRRQAIELRAAGVTALRAQRRLVVV